MKIEQPFSGGSTYCFEDLSIGECFIFEDHKYLSAILPGECFRPEDNDKVYIMTNFDEVDEKYIVVNLSTGLRVEFTPSEADAITVIRMRVDATAVPYLYITKEENSQ